MRTSFQEELARLQESILLEADLVVRSIRGATEALVVGDLELADEVIAFDDEIDEAYVAIEQAVELVIARQTPVAGDLRLVLSILHSNLHLERMGDLCTTVAKLTKLAAGFEADPVLVEGFREMGQRSDPWITTPSPHQGKAG